MALSLCLKDFSLFWTAGISTDREGEAAGWERMLGAKCDGNQPLANLLCTARFIPRCSIAGAARCLGNVLPQGPMDTAVVSSIDEAVKGVFPTKLGWGQCRRWLP